MQHNGCRFSSFEIFLILCESTRRARRQDWFHCISEIYMYWVIELLMDFPRCSHEVNESLYWKLKPRVKWPTTAQQHKQAATKWTHRRMRILNKIITLNTDFELQVCEVVTEQVYIGEGWLKYNQNQEWVIPTQHGIGDCQFTCPMYNCYCFHRSKKEKFNCLQNGSFKSYDRTETIQYSPLTFKSIWYHFYSYNWPVHWFTAK